MTMERQKITQETIARQRSSAWILECSQGWVLDFRDVCLEGYSTGLQVDDDHYLVFITMGYEETSPLTVDRYTGRTECILNSRMTSFDVRLMSYFDSKWIDQTIVRQSYVQESIHCNEGHDQRRDVNENFGKGIKSTEQRWHIEFLVLRECNRWHDDQTRPQIDTSQNENEHHRGRSRRAPSISVSEQDDSIAQRADQRDQGQVDHQDNIIQGKHRSCN